MRPKVIKNGCFWIVLRDCKLYGRSYNRSFSKWREAVDNAIKFPINGLGL